MNKNRLIISKGGGDTPSCPNNLDIQYDSDAKKLLIKWQDVECDFFGGVKVVINNDKYPENEEDGIVVQQSDIPNQYRETPMEIPFNVESDKTIYIRLFPFSSTLNINRFSRCESKIDIVIMPPHREKLADYTWEEITKISDAGKAREYFELGDTKDMVFNQHNGETIWTLPSRLVEFDRYTISGTNKKAGMCFVTDNLVCMFFGASGSMSNINVMNSLTNFTLQEPTSGYKKVVPTTTLTDVEGMTNKSILIPDYRSFDLSDNDNCFEYFKGKTNDVLVKNCITSNDDRTFIPRPYLLLYTGEAFDKTTYYVNTEGVLVKTLTNYSNFAISDNIGGVAARMWCYPLVVNI